MCTKEDYQNRAKEGFKPSWSPGPPTLPTMVKEEKMEKDDAVVDHRGGMYVLKQHYIIDGTFSEAFELKSYPFDSQQFPLKMIWPKRDMALHPAMTREFLKFDVGSMALGEWDFSAPMVEISSKAEKIATENFEMRRVQYPLLTVSLHARRVYKTTVINIYIILALITLSGIGSFCLDLEDGGDRLAHASTILLSTIAFLFIIESALPKLSYMTITDYFVFVGTVLVLAITIEMAVMSFVITHLETPISIATDNTILIINLAIWLCYVGGFYYHISYNIIPMECQLYAPPGWDQCVCHSELEDDVDFSFGPNVAFVPMSGVHQYYWELNRDHNRTFYPTWKSNDYGRDYFEYFQAYLELGPTEEESIDYAKRRGKNKNLRVRLPPLEYIRLKLLKITGDENVPAGYISVQTAKEKISPNALRSSEGLKISKETSAEVQVRANIKDPKGFYFMQPETFIREDTKMLLLDFYTMTWVPVGEEEEESDSDDEASYNFWDFFDDSDSDSKTSSESS